MPSAAWSYFAVERSAWTWDWRNILGLVLTSIFAMLSGPGGQSGNWWYIPCFTVLLQFSMKQSIPLCSFSVLLGALVSVVYAVAEVNPLLPNRPLVDYDTMLIISPPMLLGSALGVLLNAILPSWILEVLVVSMTGYMVLQMAATYWRLVKAENARKLLADGIQRELMALQQDSRQPPQVLGAGGGTSDSTGQETSDKCLPVTRQGSRLVLMVGTVKAALHGQLHKLMKLNREVQQEETIGIRYPMMTHTVTGKVQGEVQGLLAAETDEESDAHLVEQAGVVAAPAAAADDVSVSQCGSHVPAHQLDTTVAHSSVSSSRTPASSSRTATAATAAAAAATTAEAPPSPPLAAPAAAEAGLRRRKQRQQPVAVEELAARAVDHILAEPGQPAAGTATGMAACSSQLTPQQATASTTKNSSLRSRAAAWWKMQPTRLQVVLLLQVVTYFTLSVLLNVAVEPCSAAYWCLLAALAAAMLAFLCLGLWLQGHGSDSGASSRPGDSSSKLHVEASTGNQQPGVADLTADEKQQAAGQMPFVVWTPRLRRGLPAVMLLVGVVASMLGLGGGLIVNPVLLALDLHPQVVAGTAKLILLLSTGASTIAYLLRGMLLWQYGLAYGLLVMLATPVGIYAMDSLIKHTGRASNMVLLATVRLAVGFSLVATFDFVPTVRQLAAGHIEGVHLEQLCVRR